MRFPFFLLIYCLLSTTHRPLLYAATLDLTADARLRGISYKNMTLSPGTVKNDSYFSQKAGIGFLLKNIGLNDLAGNDSTLDVGILLGAVGVAGSTTSVSSPLDKAASRYPNATFTPFIANAYVKLDHFLGYPWRLTLGRQPFDLAGGLLASDDGAGFTGIKIAYPFQWHDIQTQAFLFEPRTGSGSSLDLYGFSIAVPSEGLWEINALIEKDGTGGSVGQVPVQRTIKDFYGIRYTLERGPLSFDGQGVLQSGNAKPQDPARPTIAYDGSAILLKGKWTQGMGRLGTWQARAAFGRGSGDDSSDPARNRAFSPGLGHRFDGLERDGFGDFFGATLYDAFGSTTPNGLPSGDSGIQVFNLGATLPSYKGIYTDLDYYLYQADRTVSGGIKSIGKEFDLRFHYRIKDSLVFNVSLAFFSPSGAYLTSKARRYLFEASGRF